jgi:hypothetical protein
MGFVFALRRASLTCGAGPEVLFCRRPIYRLPMLRNVMARPMGRALYNPIKVLQIRAPQ